MTTTRWVVAAVTLTATVAVTAPTAHADDHPAGEPRWMPTISAGVGALDEQLRVQVDGADTDSYRSQYRVAIALGLVHPVARAGQSLWIDGHASVGVGPTFQTGHWHVPLREDITMALAATPWLTLRWGLGVGCVLDATGTARSFGEAALPLSVTFFGTVELVYRPMLSIPLGSEASTVFGGERTLTTRLTALPFDLTLRVRFRGLGW